ncbi:MAG TPA: 3'(2'),5'-bisphosphate nucleotidase CysQ [Acidimicrobiales bacterium]|nr:3'(2'),5'-bisphosphate nucleotidase CysQ [Acidimicrobiales bacterium]
MPDLLVEDDHAVARDLASEAGKQLIELRRAAGARGGPELGFEGDRLSNRLILELLSKARPEDPVLSEEGAAPVSKEGATPSVSKEGAKPSVSKAGAASNWSGDRRLWIVDPLDGTREFSEGRDDFAVHVALVTDAEATVGAVALPGEGLVFSTADPLCLPRRREGPIRILVSRTRPPLEATLVADDLGAELMEMGSAGAKTMAVVRGLGDVYLHAGGQYEWDSAAPVAVARAAGLHATRLDGSPIRYGNPGAWLPDLLICRPEFTEAVSNALAAIHR